MEILKTIFLELNLILKIIYFLVVNLDNPKQYYLKDNIIVCSYDNNFLLSNYLKFFIFLFKNLNSPIKLFVNLNWQYLFKLQINKNLTPIIKNIDFKQCLVNYEGLPYQDHIIEFIKKKNNKTKIKVYLSAVPSPYPINYFYYQRNFIDELNVYSVEQKKLFQSFLKWPLKKIKITIPTRFEKGKFSKIPNIYLPINIINFNNVIGNLDNFLDKTKIIFCKPKIKFHPKFKSRNKKIFYKTELEKVLFKNRTKFNNKSNLKYSFFVGPTGALIEALENNVKVIQICDNNLFDKFNPNLWQNLRIKNISQGVYIYELKKKIVHYF